MFTFFIFCKQCKLVNYCVWLNFHYIRNKQWGKRARPQAVLGWVFGGEVINIFRLTVTPVSHKRKIDKIKLLSTIHYWTFSVYRNWLISLLQLAFIDCNLCSFNENNKLSFLLRKRNQLRRSTKFSTSIQLKDLFELHSSTL